MTTFQIADKDIVITNGSPVIATGMDAVIAHVTNVVKLWLGDWSEDAEKGIDWLNILGSGITDKRIASIIKNRIIEDGTITTIQTIDVTSNRAQRTISISMTVQGETIAITTEV